MSTRSLIETLDKLAGDRSGLQITLDADGTLWSGDVGWDLAHHAMSHGALRDEAKPRLAEELRAVDASRSVEDLSTTELARELLLLNGRGQYPDEATFSMMAWCFAGFSEGELTALSTEALRHAALEDRIFSFVEPLFSWAKARDVEVIICSASPLAVVWSGAQTLGVPPANIIAVTPAVDRGVVCDRLIPGPIPYGPGKVARLRERPGHRAWLAGFGDSATDRFFMAEHELAVLVSPRPELLRVEFKSALVLRGELGHFNASARPRPL